MPISQEHTDPASLLVAVSIPTHTSLPAQTCARVFPLGFLSSVCGCWYKPNRSFPHLINPEEA